MMSRLKPVNFLLIFSNRRISIPSLTGPTNRSSPGQPFAQVSKRSLRDRDFLAIFRCLRFRALNRFSLHISGQMTPGHFAQEFARLRCSLRASLVELLSMSSGIEIINRAMIASA